MASSTPGRGRAASAPAKRTARTATSWRQADEVVLEARPRPGRARPVSSARVNRSDRIVDMGSSRTPTPRRAAISRGDLAQGGPSASRLVRYRWVPRSRSPRLNHVLAAEALELLHGRPGLAGHAPAGLGVVQAGQGVGDRVEVRADVQAVQHGVVAGVDHRRECGRGDDADQSREHPGRPDAAAEGDQHAVSLGAAGPGSARGQRVGRLVEADLPATGQRDPGHRAPTRLLDGGADRHPWPPVPPSRPPGPGTGSKDRSRRPHRWGARPPRTRAGRR